MWSWDLVTHNKGITQGESIQESDAKEDVWG